MVIATSSSRILDRLKFGTSADWGLNANGKTHEQQGELLHFDAFNGGRLQEPDTRDSTMDAEGRIGLHDRSSGLTIALGFYSGKLGKDIDGVRRRPR